MKTWDEMTDAKKLENVRRRHWRDYYKAEREAAKAKLDEANAKITRLERINADLLAACEELLRVMDNDFQYQLWYSDGRDEALELAKAAVAKARGE